MMRSVFSAISGLRNHQTLLDVVGNNIANVNTTAFKMGRVVFQDILSQTIRGASTPSDTRGGINPAQIGLGMTVGGIDTISTQGNLQNTGKNTDLAIQGDGFFVLSSGRQQLYSRDGSFDLATDGSIVNPATGLHVMGWNATNGVVDTSGAPQNLRIPIGEGVIGKVTTNLNLKGNLNRDATTPFTTTISSYDSTGGEHKVSMSFTKTGANTWTWTTASADTDGTTVGAPSNGTLTFDSTTGKVTVPNPLPTMQVTPPAGTGAAAYTVTVDPSALTQLASTNDLTAVGDGMQAGSLVSFSIGASGEISGIYSNGLNVPLGKVAMALFPNQGGLVKTGANMFTVSPASGVAQVAPPDTGGRGTISAGFLEMSNVDLAQQFTSMIIAQRGFQANARIITASDEMLQELVSLKR